MTGMDGGKGARSSQANSSLSASVSDPEYVLHRTSYVHSSTRRLAWPLFPTVSHRSGEASQHTACRCASETGELLERLGSPAAAAHLSQLPAAAKLPFGPLFAYKPRLALIPRCSSVGALHSLCEIPRPSHLHLGPVKLTCMHRLPCPCPLLPCVQHLDMLPSSLASPLAALALPCPPHSSTASIPPLPLRAWRLSAVRSTVDTLSGPWLVSKLLLRPIRLLAGPVLRSLLHARLGPAFSP